MAVHKNSSQTRPGTHLIELIRANQGWLSFEQFMAAALYHPDFGYYTRNIRDVGRAGDFSTSAQPKSLLGRAIARWVVDRKKRLRAGFRWHVIEIGGGSGEMAATIWQKLGFRHRLGLTYHLVEISAPLREKQAARLRGRRMRWHDSVEAALAAAGGVALIFSNELVDAFPCRRLRCESGEWTERGVVEKDGVAVEMGRLLSAADLMEMSSSALEKPRSGTVEVQAAYRRELLVWSAAWRRGSLLTIDYGDHFPAVYHRQPNGTVRGYFHHLRIDGDEVYARIGQQDLTADVNFTDLENWGSEAGLTRRPLQTQRDFIREWLGEVTPRTTDEARLLDSHGAGGAFKVLEQSK